jgi:hypothetical protein
VTLLQLTLRLVTHAPGAKPDAAAELAATRLDDPCVTLADAGVTDGCWLLADVCSAQPRGNVVRDVVLLTDLVRIPKAPRYCVPRLSQAFLERILEHESGMCLSVSTRWDSPLLCYVDQLRDGETY